MIPPKKMQKDSFRFVRIPHKSKNPSIEGKDWNKNCHTWDSKEIKEHEGNIGVVLGYGDLRCIDADDKSTEDIIRNNLPPTLIIRTGKDGCHAYYTIKDLKDTASYRVLKTGNLAMGELRFKNSQCVCPPSIHPNGNPYKVENDIPIAEITEDRLKVFEPFITKGETATETTEKVDFGDEPGIGNVSEALGIIRRTTKWNDLLNGNWKQHGFSTRSEAELSIVSALKRKGLNFEQLNHIMTEVCQIGKWATAPKGYKEITYGKPHIKKEKKPEIGEPDENSLEILKDPNLLERINKELDKKIVGEKDTRSAIIIITAGRKTQNADSFSTNILINDPGGIGKDWIANNTLAIWPKGEVIHKKRISETVFTYLHNSFEEPDWSWDDKVVYLEDIPNRVLNCDVFKLLATNDKGKVNESTIVVKQEAVDFGCNGKPGLIITIANANPKQELLRRFPILNCDDSIDQTKAIVQRHAQFKETGIKPEYDKTIITALTYLKPVKVKIPYARALGELITTKHTIMRTNFPRFCDFIMFSATLHQYNREIDEDGFILANEQDYEIGSEVIKKITSNSLSIPLSRKQQDIITILKTLPIGMHPVSELQQHIQFLDQKNIYREMDKLSELSFVKRGIFEITQQSGNVKEITAYEFENITEFEIPTWKDINHFFETIETNETNETVETHETNTPQHYVSKNQHPATIRQMPKSVSSVSTVSTVSTLSAPQNRPKVTKSEKIQKWRDSEVSKESVHEDHIIGRFGFSKAEIDDLIKKGVLFRPTPREVRLI